MPGHPWRRPARPLIDCSSWLLPWTAPAAVKRAPAARPPSAPYVRASAYRVHLSSASPVRAEGKLSQWDGQPTVREWEQRHRPTAELLWSSVATLMSCVSLEIVYVVDAAVICRAIRSILLPTRATDINDFQPTPLLRFASIRRSCRQRYLPGALSVADRSGRLSRSLTERL